MWSCFIKCVKNGLRPIYETLLEVLRTQVVKTMQIIRKMAAVQVGKNERVKQHRKRSRFKVQTADKLNRAVYTWQRNDSHSARKDRALDNIRIERLWRSLKYEDIYPKPYETMKDLNAGINACFNFYNTARFHQSLDYNVPDEMYKCFQYNEPERKRAA